VIDVGTVCGKAECHEGALRAAAEMQKGEWRA